MRLRLLLTGILLTALLWPTASLAEGGVADRGMADSSVSPQGNSVPANRAEGLTNPQRDRLIDRSTEGAPIAAYRPEASTEPRSLAWDGARMLLTLAAVLLLLGLGVRLLRRWPNLMGRDVGMAGLQVVGRVGLAPKEAICLVRAGPEVLVVGVSPAGITLLSRLEAGGVEAIRTPTRSDDSWGGSPGGIRVDRAYSLGGGSAPAGGSCAPPSVGLRMRDLVARIRDVQAAWGLSSPPRRGEK